MPTVLVTGANRGLGLEFVRQYVRDDWNAIAVCRSDSDLAALCDLKGEINGDVDIRITDISDFPAVDRLAEELKGCPIDVLIHNAGQFGPKAQADSDLRQNFGHMDYDIWADILKVNLQAPFKLTETLIDNLRAGHGKKIAAVSTTMASVSEAGPGVYAYRTSKTALNMAMTSLSRELQPEGISVGLFCPGWVSTRMGGSEAPITPDESVSGLRQRIEELTLELSGTFRRFNGDSIPW